MRPSLAAAVILAGLAIGGVAHASGADVILPFGLDPYGGTPPEQDAFYGDGRVGVLMGNSPWSRLFAGWRLLHGQAVGLAPGHGLALPCCDANADDDITKAWRTARMAVPGVKGIDYMVVYHPVGDFDAVQTCFADAFATATSTLQDRINAHGAADPAVRAWLGGQDAVFATCHQTTDMPALPDAPPAWLVADRAYQMAAMALYDRRFAAAQAGFAAIAADPASPWQKLGPYLAARAAVDAALAGKDAAAIIAARERLQALAPDAIGHASVQPLLNALEYRSDPAARRTALIAELTAANLPDTVATDFKDMRRLGQDPASTPEFLDWLSVFGRTPDKAQAIWFEHYKVDEPWADDAAALAHARERWAATKDAAWLVAALQDSNPGPDAADLIAAAGTVRDTDPAWLTATYHRLRLDPGDPVAAGALLDAILARTDLSISTRNLFLAERAMAAANQADFLRVAQRDQACLPVQYGAKPTPTTCLGPAYQAVYEEPMAGGRFGDDALATIDRLALPERLALSEAASLSAPLRLDVALTSWTRAVLAGDDPTANRLANGLVTLLPAMAPEWRRFAATPAGPDKRFAAWFVLVKMPGASTHLAPGAMSYGIGDYTRPVGLPADYEGHWPDWAYAPAGAPPVAASGPLPDVVCGGLCGAGTFPYRAPRYVAAQEQRAEAERGRYAPAAGTPHLSYVWNEILDYARAHPDDPRTPEALHWLVRVSRYGKGHDRSSFRAFRLLKSRYATSHWAKESPYYFD